MNKFLDTLQIVVDCGGKDYVSPKKLNNTADVDAMIELYQTCTKGITLFQSIVDDFEKQTT